MSKFNYATPIASLMLVIAATGINLSASGGAEAVQSPGNGYCVQYVNTRERGSGHRVRYCNKEYLGHQTRNDTVVALGGKSYRQFERRPVYYLHDRGYRYGSWRTIRR